MADQERLTVAHGIGLFVLGFYEKAPGCLLRVEREVDCTKFECSAVCGTPKRLIAQGVLLLDVEVVSHMLGADVALLSGQQMGQRLSDAVRKRG